VVTRADRGDRRSDLRVQTCLIGSPMPSKSLQRGRKPASLNPMTASTRSEHDPLGVLDVPADAYYGVQTLRAAQNFPISGLPPLKEFVRAVIWIKKRRR